jgi:hypothetical protein
VYEKENRGAFGIVCLRYGFVAACRSACNAVSQPAESIQDGQPQYESLSSAVPFTVMSSTIVPTAGRDPARSVASVQGS